ncbi:MAG: methionine aminopeptidase [Dermatophilaceae bacterium]
MPWWYNIGTGEVEDDEGRGTGEDVLGPYATREEAARALQIAHDKTEQWDAQDREWDNRGAAPGWSKGAD